MTNKEAIELIQEIEEDGRNVTIEHIEALNLAIKALKFAESQRLCCDNCVNHTRKGKEVCTSPYGQCEFFEDEAH